MSAIRSTSAFALPLRAHVVVWTATAALIAILAILYVEYRNVDVWASWAPARELHAGHYSEAIHVNSIFRTRVNTWSNVVYFTLGLYVCAFAWNDRRNRRTTGFLAAHPVYSDLYGLACVGLALGSGLFHASLTRWGQHVDVGMMYAPPVLLLALSGARHFGRHDALSERAEQAFVVGGVSASAMLFYFKWSLSSEVVLPLLILGLLAFAVVDEKAGRTHLRFRYLVYALLAMAAGLACQWLDAARLVGGPDSFIQGHALWHLFGGVALFWVYAYHRAEEPVETADDIPAVEFYILAPVRDRKRGAD